MIHLIYRGGQHGYRWGEIDAAHLLLTTSSACLDLPRDAGHFARVLCCAGAGGSIGGGIGALDFGGCFGNGKGFVKGSAVFLGGGLIRGRV